jgi:CrcB protein
VTAVVWLGVAALGGAGACARFLVDAAVSSRTGRARPYGTLAVNLMGAFVLGALVGAALDPTAFRLAGTAAIGSYTTFSTWMLETHRLAEDGRVSEAGANVAVSLVLGVAAAALGRALGGAL